MPFAPVALKLTLKMRSRTMQRLFKFLAQSLILFAIFQCLCDHISQSTLHFMPHGLSLLLTGGDCVLEKSRQRRRRRRGRTICTRRGKIIVVILQIHSLIYITQHLICFTAIATNILILPTTTVHRCRLHSAFQVVIAWLPQVIPDCQPERKRAVAAQHTLAIVISTFGRDHWLGVVRAVHGL